MLKRLVPALALLALPMTAEAGWGFTAHQGVEYGTRGYYVSPFEHLPTIDYRSDGLIVQMDALELLAGISREELHLGVNIYKTMDAGKIQGDAWKGNYSVGASVDIDGAPGYEFDPLYAQVLGQARLGMQSQNQYGFGVFVVPGVGFSKAYDMAGDDAFELAVGGQLQISAWMK